MKIYFDESGQSSCILQKEDLLNIHFNYHYQMSLAQIFESISSENLPMEEIINLLNK